MTAYQQAIACLISQAWFLIQELKQALAELF